MKKLIIFLLALVVLVSATACSNNSKSSESSESSNSVSSASSKSDSSASKVADTAETNYSVGDASVEVRTIQAVPSDYTDIRVSVPVTNTGNMNLYLSSCTIDIEKSDGTLATTIDSVDVCPQIIKPGETAYYFEDALYDGSETEGLKAIPHVRAEQTTVDCIRFDVSDLLLKDNDHFAPTVIGRVTNTSSSDQSLINVVANLFDKDGKLLSQQSTIVKDVAPGEKMGFEISSLSEDISISDVATYDVYAYPFQY